MIGDKKLYIPLAFYTEGNNNYVKWLDIYQNGKPNFNMVEKHGATTGITAKSIIDRKYITVYDIVKLYGNYVIQNFESAIDVHDRNKKVITLSNIRDLIE